MTIILGAVVWLVMVLVPLPANLGVGTIEKLSLLGPLVVVPLGWKLCGAPGGRALPSAMLVAAAFLVPAGWMAGVLTAPWLVVCAWRAYRGFKISFEPAVLCRTAALAGLVVGAVGLLQSRWGMEPLGFREPLVLLVAVHFHFAAFVTPVITAEVVERMRRGGWWLAVGACVGSPALAMGYVVDVAALRLAGAVLLVVTLFAVAGWSLGNLRRVEPAARALIGISAVSVVVAMAYAAVYAVADYCGEVWIAIPHMARTHGVLQAVGFSVGGLWGWSLARKERGLRSLTRRWQ